jgi:hypothetical protein
MNLRGDLRRQCETGCHDIDCNWKPSGMLMKITLPQNGHSFVEYSRLASIVIQSKRSKSIAQVPKIQATPPSPTTKWISIG